MKTLTLSIALISLTIAGCHRIESHNVPTHALEADINIYSYDGLSNQVEANIRLRDDPFTYVRLSVGDSLVAASDSDLQTMFPTGYGYQAQLSSIGAEELIQIGFHRNGFASALNSQVQMPAPFQLFLSSEAGVDTDLLFIEWDTLTDEPMDINLSGPCILQETFTIDGLASEGLFIIDSANLMMDDYWAGEECGIDVTATRSRRGIIDQALWGGQINGIQSRTETFYVYR